MQRSTRQTFPVVLAAIVLAVTSPAAAQETDGDREEATALESGDWRFDMGEPVEDSESRYPPRVETALVPAPDTKIPPPVDDGEGPGILAEAGIGSFSYTGELGDAMSAGTAWTVRGVWGVHSRVGVELGYIGATNPFDAGDAQFLGFGGDSTLANGGEAQLRVSLAEEGSLVIPFLAGGVSYLRLDSDLDAFDNRQSLGFPLTGGLNILAGDRLTLGARLGYHVLTGIIDEEFPGGDMWSTLVTIGATF